MPNHRMNNGTPRDRRDAPRSPFPICLARLREFVFLLFLVRGGTLAFGWSRLGCKRATPKARAFLCSRPPWLSASDSPAPSRLGYWRRASPSKALATHAVVRPSASRPAGGTSSQCAAQPIRPRLLPGSHGANDFISHRQPQLASLPRHGPPVVRVAQLPSLARQSPERTGIGELSTATVTSVVCLIVQSLGLKNGVTAGSGGIVHRCPPSFSRWCAPAVAPG
jgi:hypothetical protein